jgi:hypothetical protein
LNQHVKTKGPVTEKEHTTFLNLWLEHFIFCGPSLAPTKNYLSLAYQLAKSDTIGLGKLFLREVYRYLHLMSSSLLSQKKLRTGGPWWFIQLWGHLYFQNHIPNSLFWLIIPFQIRVGDESDVAASAKLCTVFLVAS